MTRAPRFTSPAGGKKTQLQDTDVLSRARLASEAVEIRFFPCCGGFFVVLGFGFFLLSKPEAAPAPWAGVGAICVAGTRQAGRNQKNEEKPSTELLDPYRELFSPIPISPAKPKGVQPLLARDLGLTVSSQLCKPSPLL